MTQPIKKGSGIPWAIVVPILVVTCVFLFLAGRWLYAEHPFLALESDSIIERVEQPQVAEAPPQTDQPEVQSSEEVVRHGDECAEEEESARPYRWQLNLLEDDQGILQGTLQFHRCPDGGYLIYRVTVTGRDGDRWTLTGRKEEGLGWINEDPGATVDATFLVDVAAETIDPNLGAP
jgi:hypothetical protein